MGQANRIRGACLHPVMVGVLIQKKMVKKGKAIIGEGGGMAYVVLVGKDQKESRGEFRSSSIHWRMKCGLMCN